jgi:hypothetical protein
MYCALKLKVLTDNAALLQKISSPDLWPHLRHMHQASCTESYHNTKINIRQSNERKKNNHELNDMDVNQIKTGKQSGTSSSLSSSKCSFASSYIFFLYLKDNKHGKELFKCLESFFPSSFGFILLILFFFYLINLKPPATLVTS